jgi:hypothetical protein
MAGRAPAPRRAAIYATRSFRPRGDTGEPVFNVPLVAPGVRSLDLAGEVSIWINGNLAGVRRPKSGAKSLLSGAVWPSDNTAGLAVGVGDPTGAEVAPALAHRRLLARYRGSGPGRAVKR